MTLSRAEEVNGPEIREMRSGDLAAVTDISNWAVEHTTANFALEPESLDQWQAVWDATREMYPWLVAEQGERIIGFARALPHNPRCAYEWASETSIYVHPDAHGRGIGRALYGRLLELLRAQGYRTAVALVASGNPASERLHEALGFRHAGLLDNVGWKFGAWHSVIYYELDLRPGNAPPDAVRPVRAVTPGRNTAC